MGLPVYNGEKYIEQSLNSILAQSYTHFELIISDNASTDRTMEICRAYADKDLRIHYYRNEVNLGAAPNHNRVFNLLSGDYFKWVGYDDLIHADFLKKCVEILDNKPEVVLCMPKSVLINENSEFIEDFEYEFDGSHPEPYKRLQNLLLNLKTGNPVYGLMRSDVIRKTSLHGSFPSSDLVFLTELALYGQIYIIPERLFFRRYHREQSTKGVYAVERDRITWFDTSLKGKILLPKWLILSGYLNAIKKSHLGVLERLFCYVQLVHWVTYPAHLRALGKDILLAIQKIINRLNLRLKKVNQRAPRNP